MTVSKSNIPVLFVIIALCSLCLPSLAVKQGAAQSELQAQYRSMSQGDLLRAEQAARKQLHEDQRHFNAQGNQNLSNAQVPEQIGQMRAEARRYAMIRAELSYRQRQVSRTLESLPEPKFSENLPAEIRAFHQARSDLKHAEREHLRSLGPLTADQIDAASTGWRETKQQEHRELKDLASAIDDARPERTASIPTERELVLRQQLRTASKGERSVFIQQLRQLRQQQIETQLTSSQIK